MKTMSESLMELAPRVKQLEDSASAVRDKNRTALQTRHQQLENAIDRGVKEFETTATEGAAKTGTWWADTKNSIESQVSAMRADVQERKAEHKQDRAERRAELAEQDAAAAIALASHCLNAAEWAVVDAALARAEAEELAAAR